MEGNRELNNEVLTKQNGKKIKRIVIIVAILITLIVILAGVGVYAIIENNPKMKVFKAIKATEAQIKNKETFAEKVTDKDFSKNLKEIGTKQDINFTLNSTNDEKLKKLNGYGLNIDSLCDDNKKKLMMNVLAKHGDKELIDTEFYTDNKQLMISMPKLYDAWFTCDAENIQDQYNGSFFAQNKKELPFKEFSLKLFNDNNSKEYYGKELANVIMNGYINEDETMLKQIAEDIKVSELKDTKVIVADGEKKECKGYYVVIPGKDAKTFIDSICDYSLEDKQVKKTITKFANYAYLVDNKKYNKPQEMVDDIYSRMKEDLSKIKDNFNCEDVRADVYVDSQGRAISIEANSIINVKDEKENFKFSIDFKGNRNVANAVKMSMDLEGDKGQIEANLNSTSTKKDDLLNDETDLAIKLNKVPINFKRKYQYNEKTGEFNASASLGAKNKELSGNLKGIGNYNKTSKTLKLDFSSIDLKSTIGQNPVNISLSGSYSLSPMDKEIEAPTGEKLELFKLTKDKIISITQEIQKNSKAISGTPSVEAQKF